MRFENEFEFLSNFYPCEDTIDGYPTVEHFFQAMKTMNQLDRAIIRNAPTPGKAKRLGRKVTLRAGWWEMKIGVMRWALLRKFSDPVLAEKLKNVRGEIVEDNNWGDRLWGVCDGEGRNELGKLLMQVRSELFG